MASNYLFHLLFAVILLCISSKHKETHAQEVLDHRLPKNIIPDHYVIRVVPFYPEFFQLFGSVRINVTVVSPTDSITLHARFLSIDENSLLVRDIESNEYVDITGVRNETDSRHFYIIQLGTQLQTNGSYEIYMEYLGELKDDMFGFYRSSYTVGEEIRWLASTMFESTHARRAFPCFDEPDLKATFDISIAHYTNLTAKSNTPLIDTSGPDNDIDGRVWDTFETTVKMSTYLVAFLVSDFKNITNDRNFSIWAREDFLQYGEYSQVIGQESLDFLEEYTGIPYPLDKLDQVAVPDFSAGAEENWGLISYREAGLLYDEQTTPSANKMYIAMTIAHELAHQWFGNLVTLNWWSFTWLNEGFARFFQYFVVDAIHKEWQMMDQFVVAELQSVFQTDALTSTAALNKDCMTPAEIDAKFSSLSYPKGACVLRMIQHTLTKETFQKGIQTYLSNRQYDTAVPTDLYKALQQHAQEDIKIDPSVGTIESLFGRWASQAGYPLITVTRNYEQNTAQVTQERFLLSQPEQKPTETWSVPLTYVKQSDGLAGFEVTTPNDWFLYNETDHLISNIAAENEWVIFNKQQTGYYRVNYDLENWNKIIAYLQSDDFINVHVLNRGQLVDDSLNLARTDYISYDTALKITEYLIQETEYIPWNSAFTAFSYISSLLFDTDAYSSLQEYILELLEKSYEYVGFEEGADDTLLKTLHRSNVITWACALGHEDCISHAKEQFNNWVYSEDPDKNNTMSPNIRSAIYCTAIAHSGEEEWNFLWDRFLGAQLASQKTLILSALGCSKNTSILTGYLRRSITENSGIRKQDTASVFNSVYSNPDGVNIALNFLINNYEQISNFYGGLGMIGNSLTGIASRLSTEAQINSLRTFVTENEEKLGSAATLARNAVESAQSNLDWKNKYYDIIETWLLSRSQSTTVFDESTTEGGSILYHEVQSILLIITATFFYLHITSVI